MPKKKRYEARKPQQYGTEVEIFDHSTGFKMVADFNAFYGYSCNGLSFQRVDRLPAYIFKEVYALEARYEQTLKARALNTEVMEARLLVHCTHDSEIRQAVQSRARQAVFSRVRDRAKVLYSQWDHHESPLCYQNETRVIDYLSRRKFIDEVISESADQLAKHELRAERSGS